VNIYVYMHVCRYEHMHVYAYVDLCIYEFVSVSTFNQMQILTKFGTILRHFRTLKGKKIYVSKNKSNGMRNFVVEETKITPQPIVSSDNDNRSCQSSDIWCFSFLNYIFSNGQLTVLNHFISKLLGLAGQVNYNGLIIIPREWIVRSEHVGHFGV